MSTEDEQINDDIQHAISDSPNKQNMTLDWPKISEKPVDEFTNKRIFTCAFPWLFPGGYGDPRDYPGSLVAWGRHMLYYEDGRFATDKFFCFFALNHIIRMRNATYGSWFINRFHKGVPENMDDLKDQIAAGNNSFVTSLSYYNRSITGSGPYWFKKRCELYSWINHHVEVGNGAPTMFITLSCAEYHWADVIDKIRERMVIAGQDTSSCHLGAKGLTAIVNDYSIVVQEYFQKRVIQWLQSVGKEIFHVKHYWIRYEFAPGRGQIHAHLLAIPDNHAINELCYLDSKDKINGEQMRAERMAKWAQDNLGLTASVSPDFAHLKDSKLSPMSMRFTDVKDLPMSCEEDFQMLMKDVQIHNCSGFCMRCKSDQ
jgi:hypothetical protein